MNIIKKAVKFFFPIFFEDDSFGEFVKGGPRGIYIDYDKLLKTKKGWDSFVKKGDDYEG